MQHRKINASVTIIDIIQHRNDIVSVMTTNDIMQQYCSITFILLSVMTTNDVMQHRNNTVSAGMYIIQVGPFSYPIGPIFLLRGPSNSYFIFFIFMLWQRSCW